MIRCPECGSFAKTDHHVQETLFEWGCDECGRKFEVRIVFFRRPQLVDAAAFRGEVDKRLQEQGLSKAELARLVGVSGAYISTLLSGRRKISEGVAERVLHILRNAQSKANRQGESSH